MIVCFYFTCAAFLAFPALAEGVVKIQRFDRILPIPFVVVRVYSHIEAMLYFLSSALSTRCEWSARSLLRTAMLLF